MDVVRPRTRTRTLPKGALAAILVAALIGFGAWGIFSLARPTRSERLLDRASVLTDTAQRGTLVRAIRATGTFVPEHIAIVAAPTDGLVQTVDVKPGARVAPGSVIARLQSLDLQADIVDRRTQISAGQAELASLYQQVRSTQLDALSSEQTAAAERQQAEMQARANEALHRLGLIPDVTYDVAKIKVQELRGQERVAQSKIAVARAEGRAQIAVGQAKIEQLEAQLAAKNTELDALTTRAATVGVVQSVAVDPGQRVAAGGELARVADQRDLKVVLLVAEADAHDVTPGLPVSIDTGFGNAHGRVARIDPAAQNGSVAVDVIFDGTAPAGARPDLHVEGAIDLERIPHAVSIARPTGAADDTDVDLYKLTGDGTRAVRVQARLGRGSIDRVHVLSGVAPGDTIIISDTSAAQGAASVLLR